MANWASTSYAIEGPRKTLEKIEKAILSHPVTKGADEHWEGDILNALGCKWTDRSNDRENGKYMRGFTQDEPWWGDDDHTSLRFYAEEAWGATDFHKVLEENLPDVKVYYEVEEIGEEIYATNDKEGKYFPERYWVDTCINGDYDSDYFIKEESVYAWLSRKTNGEVTDAKSVEAWNDKHEELNDGDENFISIHEIKVVE